MKYKEAEVDRLVAILKTNNCGGGGPCGIQLAACLGEGCLISGNLCYITRKYLHSFIAIVYQDEIFET